MKYIHSFLVFLLLMSAYTSVFAYSVPEATGYVYDEAEVFSAQEEAAITDAITALQKKTDTEIAVIFLISLHGEDVFDVAMDFADTWKVGDAKKDNGIIILNSLQDREYQILTGYGLEGVLPDIMTHKLAQQFMIPAFRDVQYAQGIIDIIDAMGRVIEGDEEIMSQMNNIQVVGSGSNAKVLSNMQTLYLLFLIIFCLFLVGGIRLESLPFSRVWIAFLLIFLLTWAIIDISAGYFASLFTFALSYGGGVYTMGNNGSFSMGSSGGGFSGFGGGGFGGGGSRGSW